MKAIIVLLLALLLGACSVQISDVTPIATSLSPTASTSHPGNPETPSNVTLTAVPAPLPWANLHLSGKLIYITFSEQTRSTPILVQLDLATGKQTILFQPPGNAWVTAEAMSPDGKQFVLSYLPPAIPGQTQAGYTELYLMPADGSGGPLPLLTHSQQQEAFLCPVWSPDGRYIYYVHVIPDTSKTDQFTYLFRLERLAYPDGQPEVLNDHAYWPRLSPDGSKLVYVAFDPPNGINDLYLSDPQGRNPVPLVPPGTFQSVDAPFFSPDGNTVYFSATGDGPASSLAAKTRDAGWLDRLLGVHAAFANGAPSDWWRIPAAGGQLQRLTRIANSGLYGNFAPDGQHIAFVSATGVFVMNPDGSGLLQILGISAVGTADWIP